MLFTAQNDKIGVFDLKWMNVQHELKSDKFFNAFLNNHEKEKFRF